VKLPYEIPPIVWLGKKIGEWPIECFPSLDMAQRWASESDGLRDRVFWSVRIPEDTVVYKSEVVPQTFRQKQVYP
jgi:hypothetical protein